MVICFLVISALNHMIWPYLVQKHIITWQKLSECYDDTSSNTQFPGGLILQYAKLCHDFIFDWVCVMSLFNIFETWFLNGWSLYGNCPKHFMTQLNATQQQWKIQNIIKCIHNQSHCNYHWYLYYGNYFEHLTI